NRFSNPMPMCHALRRSCLGLWPSPLTLPSPPEERGSFPAGLLGVARRIYAAGVVGGPIGISERGGARGERSERRQTVYRDPRRRSVRPGGARPTGDPDLGGPHFRDRRG